MRNERERESERESERARGEKVLLAEENSNKSEVGWSQNVKVVFSPCFNIDTEIKSETCLKVSISLWLSLMWEVQALLYKRTMGR